MSSKINFEEISFGIIGDAGNAKGLAMEAFELASKNKFKEANEKIKEAEKSIEEAGKKHMDVIVEEANGIQHNFSVLFMHAEDQFLTTQTFILTVKLMIKMLNK